MDNSSTGTFFARLPDRLRRYLRVLFWASVILVGFAWIVHDNEKSRQKKAAHDRSRLSTQTAPVIREHNFAQGQILVIDVPTPDQYGSGLIETKRCFVWRDTLSTTSAISCDPSPMLTVESHP